MRLSDFKFEVQQFLDSIEAFLRSAIAEPFARPGIESVLDSIAVAAFFNLFLGFGSLFIQAE